MLNKKKIFLIFLVPLFVLFVFSYSYITNVKPISLKHVSFIKAAIAETPIGEILIGKEVRQSFKTIRKISGVSILFATYARKNTGSIIVQLLFDGKSVLNKEVKCESMVDNSFIEFDLNRSIDTPEAKICEIVIASAGGRPGNAVTIWGSKGNTYRDGKLSINGIEQPGDIIFEVYSGENHFISSLYWRFSSIMLFFLVLLCYVLFLKKIVLERIFFLMACVLGTVYMFLFPPLSIPDERAHFGTAYTYSNMFLGQPAFSKDGHLLFREADFDIAGFSPYPNISAYKIMHDRLFELTAKSGLVNQYREFFQTLPFNYLFSAAGITLARILHLNIVPLLLIGRSFNLIFFIILTYFGIKKIPFGKMILFSVALLPMSLQQAASFSCDAILIGLAFFLIGYGLYLAFDKAQVTTKDMILFGVPLVFIAMSKNGAYFLFSIICLLIPIKKFSSVSKAIISKFSLVFCSLTAFVIANSKLSVQISSFVSSKNHLYQLPFIFGHPLLFLLYCINTLCASFYFYFTSMIGSHLGWLDIYPSMLWIIAFFIVICLTAFRRQEEPQYLEALNKIWIALICIAVFAMNS